LFQYLHLDHIAVLQLGALSLRGKGGEVADGVVNRDAGGETDT
jgi:hypothetical protein